MAKEYYDDLMFVPRAPRVVRDSVPGTTSTMGQTVLKARSVLLPSRRAGYLLTPAARPSSPRILGREQSTVQEAHQWVRARDAIILDEPQEFPQYGPHCFATCWLDPHGFKLEAVGHAPEESWAGGFRDIPAHWCTKPSPTSNATLPHSRSPRSSRLSPAATACQEERSAMDLPLPPREVRRPEPSWR